MSRGTGEEMKEKMQTAELIEAYLQMDAHKIMRNKMITIQENYDLVVCLKNQSQKTWIMDV